MHCILYSISTVIETMPYYGQRGLSNDNMTRVYEYEKENRISKTNTVACDSI